MQRVEVLDRAKRNTGSDGATARLIGVSVQTMSNYRQNRRAIPEAKRFDLAELAALTQDELVAWLRAEAGHEKKAWGTVLAGALLSAGLLVIGGAPSAAHAGGLDWPRQCILCIPNVISSVISSSSDLVTMLLACRLEPA